MLFIICALPMATMIISIIAPDVSIYDATGVPMLPTMNYIYVFAIILLQILTGKGKIQLIQEMWLLGSEILIIMMLLTMESQGQVYQKHNMEKTYYVACQMVDEIEKIGGEHKICIVGEMENGNYPELYPELQESLKWLTASKGTIWKNYAGAQNGWNMFMKQYIGKSYSICKSTKYDDIKTTTEFQGMTNFPEEGSVQLIDDVIVIKLSDSTW